MPGTQLALGKYVLDEVTFTVCWAGRVGKWGSMGGWQRGTGKRMTGFVWGVWSSRYFQDLQGERSTRFKAEDMRSELEVSTWGLSSN